MDVNCARLPLAFPGILWHGFLVQTLKMCVFFFFLSTGNKVNVLFPGESICQVHN